MTETSSELTEPRNKRSERARAAVLHAADDLLIERGYAGLTIERIAARAGVAKQTIYRWWNSKAEILVEAYAADAAEALDRLVSDDGTTDLPAYLCEVARFLRDTPAGAVYRALLGEAQHNPDVALLLRSRYGIDQHLRTVLESASLPAEDRGTAEAQLLGPVLYRVLVTGDPVDLPFTRALVRGTLPTGDTES